MSTAIDTAPLRVGIYARISQDRGEKRLGVDRQIEACRTLAATRGWEVVDTYIDNGVSAFSGVYRENFNRMQRDVLSGRIDCMVAWDTSRLYRREETKIELVKLAGVTNVGIFTVQDGEIVLGTTGGWLDATLRSVLAEHESRLKSDRVKAAAR